MQRSTLIIFLLAAAIVICAAVLVLLLVNPQSSPAPSPTLSPSPPIASPVIISPTPTSTPFTDASNIFSLTLPDGWKVTESNGARGVSVSSLSAESPDFRMHTDESGDGPFIPQYYDQGARFFLNAMRGPGNPTPRSSEPITIDGAPGWFASVNEPSTTQGQDLQANVEKDGVTYAFDFSYNPDTFPEGEHAFREILDSFMFL